MTQHDQTDPDGILAPDGALHAARATFASWLGHVERDSKLLVFCHFDADGLAAGALFGRGLALLGYTGVEVVASGRGESAFSDQARQRLAAYRPDALIVTDLGVNRAGVLPDVPTLLVDHHQPDGEPAGAVISGYQWQPIPTSAWLAYELLEPLAPIEDLLWIAAVGTISDLGERAPWPRLDQAKRRWGATALKEAVALVNAARRAAAFDIATPLRLLLAADGPKQLAADEQGGAARLRAYREEVNAELKAARRVAPRFAVGQPFALLRFSSPSQIHPLIAQQWRRRLPKYVVIAANDGFLPGTVAFSARTDRADLNVPRLLRAVDLGAAYPSFGHGHDAASGGQLPTEVFERLLSALGFGREGRQ